MYPVSAQFLTALADSRRMVTTADIYFQQSYIASVPIDSGSVTVDRGSKTRRTAQLTIADSAFWPTFAKSPLAPYGAELVIKQGIQYPSGVIEPVSLGTLRINQVQRSRKTGMPAVTAADRSAAVADAGLVNPIDRGGWGVKDLLSHLITDVLVSNNIPYGKVVIDPTLVDGTVPGGTVFSNDRWDAVTTCATYLGAEVYADPDGVFHVVPVPTLTQSTPASAAVWTVAAGEGGVLVEANEGVSRVGVFNQIAAYGSNVGSAAPPVAYAQDLDPRSPTYLNGPFGQVSNVITNSLWLTTADCQRGANAALANSLGLARSLDFTALPNPALEGGDIIKVLYSDGTSELHLIDTMTIPLSTKSGQWQATTRTLTYQLTAGT